MAYDAADGYIVLFGGVNSSTSSWSNQTWTYVGGVWTQLNPRASPSPRSGGMMAYDANAKEIVLFGGQGQGWDCSPGVWICNDTWTFSAGQWTNVTSTARGMGAEAYGGMAFDPQVHHVVEFGGWYDPCGCVNWISDGLYSFAKGSWHGIPAKGIGRSSKLPGDGAAIAYDEKDKSLLEFGGWIQSSNGATTWNYSNHRWTQQKVPTSPSWRFAPNLVFDPKLGHIILFGGSNDTTGAGLNDTWKYVGGNWIQFHPAQAPPAFYYPAAAAYDAADGYLLLYGGQSGSSGSSNDTWVLT
ncbi:MAG: hypothetical protein ACHQ2Y_01520 [Candidatus Lutacidiplasmatales archaeon]